MEWKAGKLQLFRKADKLVTDEPAPDSEGLAENAVSNKVFTIPNLISFFRLCLAPVFFILLINGYDFLAVLCFACAAGTDWIDGQIARRTNSVTKLGQILDPAVDRVLLALGVIGLALISRLPIWIVAVLLLRDLVLLFGGFYLLARFRIRIPVVFAGKVTTTILMIGFCGLLLNWPLIPGLGVTGFSWLPGLSAAPVSWGIWFIYIGLVLSLAVALYYIYTASRKVEQKRTGTDGSIT